MSQDQLVNAYVRGDISRRTFVRRSVALGISLTAALTYADILGRTDTARANSCYPQYENLQGGPPTVQTLSAVDVDHNSATLRGFVDMDQECGWTFFRYGPTTVYNRQTPDDDAPQEGEFSYYVGGLTPSTTYHFKAFARNGVGSDEGEDMTFTTAAAPNPDPDPDPDPDPEQVSDEDEFEDSNTSDDLGDRNVGAGPGTGAGAATFAGTAPVVFGAVGSPPPRRLVLDIDGVIQNLVTVRRRRALGIEVTASDAATVDVVATIGTLVRRLGRKPTVRHVEIGAGSVRFRDGGTKLAELRISRRGLRLLARRSRVTVTLVATARPDDAAQAWRATRGKVLLEHPRRRRR